MKRLLIMRHGKSDWSAGGRTDHERPLNQRGTTAAATMGKLLSQIGEVPERIITSSARRALSTAEIAVAAGDWAAPIDVTDDLYGTSPEGALMVLRRTPDSVSRLMLVGHEPTWSGLTERLTGGVVAMKTTTVAIIDLMLGSTWQHDGDITGELIALLQPRHFEDPTHD